MSLYIFDKDKTLLRAVRSRWFFKRSPLKPEEQTLRKGVFEKLAELRQGGHQIAIATNQIAVAHGIITLDEAEELVRNCADKVGGVSAWRLCPCDPKAKIWLNDRENPFARDDPNRKPHPGMILEIMDELGVSPWDTFMIGDKKVDRQSAKAADVTFIDEKKFFKSRKKRKQSPGR
ncbi:MAG: HAD-IIIA family hydrolase [Bacteroidota bacterium]